MKLVIGDAESIRMVEKAREAGVVEQLGGFPRCPECKERMPLAHTEKHPPDISFLTLVFECTPVVGGTHRTTILRHVPLVGWREAAE